MKRQQQASGNARGDVGMANGVTAAGMLVLVVDDDVDARTVWTECLFHLGYRSLCASTGEEGIRMAIEERPRAILMDVTMPGMGGIEATRSLKTDARTRDSLVIVVTACETEIFAEALAAGCDAYFCKPFNAFALDGILRLLTVPQRRGRGSPVVKRCACGRSYTRDEWSRLRLYGGMHIPDSGEAIEVRSCDCGWYIVMPARGGPDGRSDHRPATRFAHGPT
jgi:CheY-like chemotaxis protein